MSDAHENCSLTNPIRRGEQNMGKRILLAVDGSERNLQAVSILGQLLKNHGESEILLYHCVQQSTMLYPGEVAGVDGAELWSADAQKSYGDAILDSSRKSLLAN